MRVLGSFLLIPACWSVAPAPVSFQHAGLDDISGRKFELLGHGEPGSVPIDEETQGCFGDENLPAQGDGVVTFGVHPTLATDLSCTWTLPPRGTETQIVFTSMGLETLRDFITVESSSAKLAIFSGEYSVPSVVVVPPSGTIQVKYQGQQSPISPNRTLPVSFTATFVYGDACWDDCNGHGECVSATCKCEPGFGGDTCAIHTPVAEFNVPQTILNLARGSFAYYSFTLESRAEVLVEFIDGSHAKATPLLALGLLPPTNNPHSFFKEDMDAWFLDHTDIHHLPASLGPGTYFVGLTNYEKGVVLEEEDAYHMLNGSLTVRMNPRGKSCLGDCFGQGECDVATGSCVCADGFTGAMKDGRNTCQYPVTPVPLDREVEGQVRMGDWVYHSITVHEEVAGRRSLMVHFNSDSPDAHGIVLLRKSSVPALRASLTPTYGSFAMDYGDELGFGLQKGKEQTILLSPSQLEAGEYFIGVFNLWGHDGLAQQSADTLNYRLYANLYSSGKPCPMSAMEFCGGHPCDFNTGVCACPQGLVGESCSMETASLVPGGEPVNGTLAIGEETIFHVHLNREDRPAETNLIVQLTKPLEQGSSPYLLARKGAAPFIQDHSLHDEHDLQAFFFGSDVHTIVVDRTQLSEGSWYIKVVNPEELSQAALTYSITAALEPTLPCPSMDHASDCSGHGTCDSSTGRCLCEEGWTMDACEARGVMPWSAAYSDAIANMGEGEGGRPASDTLPEVHPTLPVNGWGFWSIPVGCKGLELEVTLEVFDLLSSPMLMIRRDQLPLQVEASANYYDYFRGLTHPGHTQRVIVRDCMEVDGECEGFVAPLSRVEDGPPGTVWAMGSPEPGIMYVGVYNDFLLGQGSMGNYTINMKVTGACSGPCAPGFSGERCEHVCPGVAPLNEYSHAPMPRGRACSSHGTCGGDTCTCDEGFFGESCSLACPSRDGNVCNDHGTCDLDTASGMPTCTCENDFTGRTCSLECRGGCNGHGTCASDETDTEARCECDFPFVGASCGLRCPEDEAGSPCSDHGACVVVRKQGEPEEARCMCEAGFAGPACASEEEVLVAESRAAHTTLPPSRVPAWVTPMAVTLSLLLVSAVAAAAYLYTVAERRKHKLLAGSQYARPSDQASMEDVEAKGKKSSSSSSSPERLSVLQLRNAKQRACSTDVEDEEEEQGFVNKDFTVDMGGGDDDDLENSI